VTQTILLQRSICTFLLLVYIARGGQERGGGTNRRHAQQLCNPAADEDQPHQWDTHTPLFQEAPSARPDSMVLDHTPPWCAAAFDCCQQLMPTTAVLQVCSHPTQPRLAQASLSISTTAYTSPDVGSFRQCWLTHPIPLHGPAMQCVRVGHCACQMCQATCTCPARCSCAVYATLQRLSSPHFFDSNPQQST
jgi:hypothetical protein